MYTNCNLVNMIYTHTFKLSKQSRQLRDLNMRILRAKTDYIKTPSPYKLWCIKNLTKRKAGLYVKLY